jgi:acyl-CoA synthetase (AMP-forming)/AMP-acid ligase II
MSLAHELVIDLLARAAHERPHELLLPDRPGPEWRTLTNADVWAGSGAVASWLIAQGYGPGGKTLSVPSDETPRRVLLLLGALRAGALAVEGPLDVPYEAMANCSIDAAVAERRLHIDAGTPARRIGGVCRRHGDFTSIADALTG